MNTIYETFRHCLSPRTFYSNLLYNVDRTFHITSGLLVEFLASHFPPFQENPEKLKEWGQKKGDIELVNFTKLRGNKYPVVGSIIDYYNTISVLAGRRTFYKADNSAAKAKIIDKIQKQVTETFNEKKDSTRVELLMKEVVSILEVDEKNKSPGYLARFKQLLHKYPNTRYKLYASWILRFGIIYYLVPFKNTWINTAITILGIYYLTIPPSKILKDSEGPTLRPKNPSLLSQQIIEDIFSNASKAYDATQAKRLKENLRNLDLSKCYDDPFHKENEFDLRNQEQEFKKIRDEKTHQSSKWYKYELRRTTALVKLFQLKGEKQRLKTEDTFRKQTWREWQSKFSDDAEKYLSKELKVSQEKIQTEWFNQKSTINTTKTEKPKNNSKKKILV